MYTTSVLSAFFGDRGLGSLQSAPEGPSATNRQQNLSSSAAMHEGAQASSSMVTAAIPMPEGASSSIAAAAAYYRRQQQQQQRKAAGTSLALAPTSNPAAAGTAGSSVMLPATGCNMTALYGNLRTSMLKTAAQHQAPASSATSVTPAAPTWSFANSSGTAGPNSGGSNNTAACAAGSHLPLLQLPASNRGSSSSTPGTADWVASATDTSAALAAAAAAGAAYGQINNDSRAGAAAGAAKSGARAPPHMPTAELLGSLLAGSLHSSLSAASPGTAPCNNTPACLTAGLSGYPYTLCSTAGSSQQGHEPSSLVMNMQGAMLAAASGPADDTSLLLDQHSSLLQQMQHLQSANQAYRNTAAAAAAKPVMSLFDASYPSANPAGATLSSNPDCNLLTSLQQLQQTFTTAQETEREVTWFAQAAEALGPAAVAGPAGQQGGMLLLEQASPGGLQAFAAAAPGFTAAGMPDLQAYMLQDMSCTNSQHQHCQPAAAAPGCYIVHHHTSASAAAAPRPGLDLCQSGTAATGFAAAPDAAALQQAALPCITPGAAAALQPSAAMLAAAGPCSSGSSCNSSSHLQALDQRTMTQGNGPSGPSELQHHGAHNPLYKTELCRSWQDTGSCRYGTRCQFAHGSNELRPLLRHPKYRTQPCRTFSLTGRCAYGERCTFIHDLLPSLQLAAAAAAGGGTGSRGGSLSGAARTSSSGIDASVIIVPAGAAAATGSGSDKRE